MPFDGRCVVAGGLDHDHATTPLLLGLFRCSLGLFFAGGFDNDHSTTPAVESHNPLLGTWEPMGRLVLARDSFSLVKQANKESYLT